MKTKNIFRMLLVAAALLMGANNVKAVETILWNGPGTSSCVMVNGSSFTGLTGDITLRVYTNDGTQIFIAAGSDQYNEGNDKPLFYSPDNQWIRSGEYYKSEGFFAFPLTADMITKLSANGLIVKDYQTRISKVSIITDGSQTVSSLQEGENVVSSEEKYCDDYGQGITFSSDLFQGASAGNTVRIYGDFSNGEWATEFMYVDNGWKKVYIPEWGNNYQANAGTTTVKSNNNGSYVEFELTNDNLPSIKDHSTLVVQGHKFTVKKVVIYVAPTSAKTTPTLSFGQTTVFNITFGDSFTGPTATCDISGLEITYESDNRSVADVATYTGEVTIYNAGQAIITARTQASDDYNAASASYTLNIAMAYSVNVNAVSNGSVSVDKSSSAAGQTVTITTTPNSGYELESISVKDASNNTVTLNGEGNTRTFTMPASNVTVNATFTPSYSVPEGAERNYLTFETQEYCAATWDSNTNTFTWGNRDGWNTAWTFMAAQNISGDLSNWTHLHLHVSNWTNASAKQLRVVFKEADGNVPSNGDTKEFVVSPNATGNIDLNLVGVNWGNCEIKNIYDLTIYGCARDVESQAASVLVTDAYYVTATVSETYTVSVSAVSHGSVSVNKTSAAKGETVTITTTPDSGYELESISVKDASNNTVTLSGSGNTRTFTMPASNVTVTVTFKEIQTTVNGVLDIVDMGDYIYRTYVTPCVIDFSKSDGVEGYWATSYDEESVTFTQVTSTCDVGVPVLLKKKTGAEVFKLWKLTDEDASGNRPDINYLVAGPATAYGANKYVLTVHSGEVVFAEVNINSATVDRQHAYLDLNGSNARGRLTIKLSGESTGIQSLQSDERSLEGTVYNLRGQRVEHPSKGIYIINGKKVVIK